MLKIGITGDIGSGKSTVRTIFKCLGVPIFHADEEGRRLLSEDEATKQQVIKLLGTGILSNNSLDRKKIAAIIFNDKEKLEKLNTIIHPKVRQAFTHWANAQKADIVIDEAAILFESGAYQSLDGVIVITAQESIRIQRVMKRDAVSEASVRERIKNQWSEKEKMERASFVIHNDGQSLVIPQVLDIYKKLSKGLIK